MSNYHMGLKAVYALCAEQNTLRWHNAKLNDSLFKGDEVDVFRWVQKHVSSHHKLPQIETLVSKWPEAAEVTAPEPSSYYIEHLEKAYFHREINNANIESQKVLKEDQGDSDKAILILQSAINRITQQKYRSKVLGVSKELKDLVMLAYHKSTDNEEISEFGVMKLVDGI